MPRWLLGVFVTLLAPGVRAEPIARPFSVTYRPSVACPALDRFEQELARRLPPGAAPSSNSRVASFQLSVAVTADGEKFAGDLLLQEAGGQVTTRRVSGASCDEVVSALALVGALLIESTASAVVSTPPPATRRDAPRMPTPPTRRPPLRVRERAAVPPARRVGWRVGAGALYHGTVGPSARPGAEWLGGALLPWGRLEELLLEVALQSTLEQSRTTPSGTASFDWTSLSLLGCPLRWPALGMLAARPCAVLELGELTGVGLSTERAAKAGMLWLAPGAVVRLEASLSGPLTLVLGAGVVAPLVRDRFYFEPRTEENVAFRVPTWGARVELLLAARL